MFVKEGAGWLECKACVILIITTVVPYLHIYQKNVQKIWSMRTCRRGEWLDGRTCDVGAVVRETVDYRDATAA